MLRDGGLTVVAVCTICYSVAKQHPDQLLIHVILETKGDAVAV